MTLIRDLSLYQNMIAVMVVEIMLKAGALVVLYVRSRLLMRLDLGLVTLSCLTMVGRC